MAQVLRVAHVVVGGRTVREHQDEPLAARPASQEGAGVTQGGPHAGRQLAGHAGQTRPRGVVVGRVEVLEAEILHVVPAVGVEAVDGEGIADLAQGVGQQGGGLAGQVENGAGVR